VPGQGLACSLLVISDDAAGLRQQPPLIGAINSRKSYWRELGGSPRGAAGLMRLSARNRAAAMLAQAISDFSPSVQLKTAARSGCVHSRVRLSWAVAVS
jgi:hypothetical protein